jgi:hypothetical protein
MPMKRHCLTKNLNLTGLLGVSFAAAFAMSCDSSCSRRSSASWLRGDGVSVRHSFNTPTGH